MRSLNAAIKEVGWAGALLYNERTERLIDGHARKELVEGNGGELVPVLVGSWTEEQEKIILATLDPIAGLAETSDKALVNLLDEIECDNPDLDYLLGRGEDDSTDREHFPGEVPISPELFERHDYLVVLIENQFDWQVICEALNIGTVESAEVYKKSLKHKGIGRVIEAQAILDVLKEAGRI